MSVKQGKGIMYYNDLVHIYWLCHPSLGCFDYDKLKTYIQRLDIEVHYIQDGSVECIRRNDYWRIATLAFNQAFMGDEKPEVLRQKYEGKLQRKKDVAEIIGHSIRTVDRLIANGELEAIKLGDRKQSSIRVNGSSLDSYLSNTVK